MKGRLEQFRAKKKRERAKRLKQAADNIDSHLGLDYCLELLEEFDKLKPKPIFTPPRYNEAYFEAMEHLNSNPSY